MYLNVRKMTFYLFLLLDQASSHLIAKLFKEISVNNVKEYLLSLFGIIGLNETLISDSGPENSEVLTSALETSGVRQKRISPGASDQNNSNSNIRVFRATLKKMIAN